MYCFAILFVCLLQAHCSVKHYHYKLFVVVTNFFMNGNTNDKYIFQYIYDLLCPGFTSFIIRAVFVLIMLTALLDLFM